MNKLVTLSRLTCLTTALAAGPALMATSAIAKDKGGGQRGDNAYVQRQVQHGNSHSGNSTKRNGIRPHFVISGQNADVKRVLRHRKEKLHEAYCKSNCSKPTQTTTNGTSTTSATSVKAGRGVHVVRQANGAVSIAARPASTPLTGKGDIVDGVKGLEVFYRTLGTIPAAVGVGGLAATSIPNQIAGTIEYRDPIGGPLQATIDTAGDLAKDVAKEISSWW
jgi:hypothetical protein